MLRWLTGGSGGAVRTFSDLNENSHEYTAKYRARLGPARRRSTLKVGGLYRATGRDAQSLSYAIAAQECPERDPRAPARADLRRTFQPRRRRTSSPSARSRRADRTSRSDRLSAGFAMAEVPIGARLRVIGGARYESDDLDGRRRLDARDRRSRRNKRWNDLLPSLALNVKLTETQQLRISAHPHAGAARVPRAVADHQPRRHQRREPARRREPQAHARDERRHALGDVSEHRRDLERRAVREAVQPADRARVWLGQRRHELRVLHERGRAPTTTAWSSRRAEDLGGVVPALEPLTLFSNVTVMKSQIHLFPNTLAAATNLSRRMVGQAPYVVNAGLTYASPQRRVDRDAAVQSRRRAHHGGGGSPLPDVIEQPRNVLDFSFRRAITSGRDAPRRFQEPARRAVRRAARHRDARVLSVRAAR